ncbi:MAG: prepilin-type N-terminal cleavage/methylation domain-containing protein [Sulfurimonas sp.]|nr:prepilin-type N-terminal cleavage/methylation domain-containing protein [Sulfurimonas sp.]
MKFFFGISSQKKEKYKRDAFSLIELLIVILIIGVVYTLAVSNIQSLKDDKVKPSLLNLKNYLTSFSYERSIKLMCFDKCNKCSIYIDEKLDKERSNDFDNFLDSSVKTYRYDFNLGMINLKNKIYFNSRGNEEEICFSYEVDKKGVGTQMIVEYEGYIYDFTQYFTDTLRYSSLGDVITAKEEQVQKVLR